MFVSRHTFSSLQHASVALKCQISCTTKILLANSSSWSDRVAEVERCAGVSAEGIKLEEQAWGERGKRGLKVKAKMLSISFVTVDLTGLLFCSSLFLFFNVNKGKTHIAQIINRPDRGNQILNSLRSISEVYSALL